MTRTIETLLGPLPGFRSAAVSRFVWQLNAQRTSLLAGVEGLLPAELDWQPHPGMNTIGMLLAHIAYAESHLAQVGLEGRATSDTKSVIGITEDDEGLPLAPGAAPSPALLGRPLEDFVDMLDRARAYTTRVAMEMVDDDLERRIERTPRRDGTHRVFNVGWVFYHLIEHEAGHHAQINLVRHLYRIRSAG